MDHSPVLLSGLGVASEQDAGHAVAHEDGHRAVVGLGKEFARRQSLMSTETR
jgi:hypothetical protein